MEWKDWSSTKKGAIVGGIIGLVGIISIIFLILVGPTSNAVLQNPLVIFSFGSLSLFLSLLCLAGGGIACGVITMGIGFILTLIVWMTFGGIIGWIAGKIKHRWITIMLIIILVILFIALGIYLTQIY